MKKLEYSVHCVSKDVDDNLSIGDTFNDGTVVEGTYDREHDNLLIITRKVVDCYEKADALTGGNGQDVATPSTEWIA
jgi:hypothetical protein